MLHNSHRRRATHPTTLLVSGKFEIPPCMRIKNNRLCIEVLRDFYIPTGKVQDTGKKTIYF